MCSGWVVGGNPGNLTWELLGRADPQQPQQFRPPSTETALSPGDIIAARCVFEGGNTEILQVRSSRLAMIALFKFFCSIVLIVPK